MTRERLVVLSCACAAFAAGVAAGVAWQQSTSRPSRDSWIAHALDLTPEQRKQMREIWSGVVGVVQEHQREQRKAARQERDEAIRALFNEEQRKHYDEIMQKYADKSKALDESKSKAFEEAVARTKRILTEPQRKKYEELLKHKPHFGRPRRGRRP